MEPSSLRSVRFFGVPIRPWSPGIFALLWVGALVLWLGEGVASAAVRARLALPPVDVWALARSPNVAAELLLRFADFLALGPFLFLFVGPWRWRQVRRAQAAAQASTPSA